MASGDGHRAGELASEDVPPHARANELELEAAGPVARVLTTEALLTETRTEKKRSKRELARDAWRRLRGGDLTPARAAASVAVGLAIGVTPLWGVHWALVLAICLPLRLDAGVAYLASNVSLPFIAPFITFAEIELGARVLRGAWLPLTRDDLRSLDLRTVAAEIAVGTAAVAAIASSTIGGLTYALVAWRRSRRLRKREPID